ncbi:MAG: hypothetical protein NZ773_11835, partial [Dehalococcoidia bacterium]|nr:hypothetical protein [Dehalococcoidia bacterium]
VKALKQSLVQPQYIAQANKGVFWVVLTNGLVYQIYKLNEPVSMANKLVMEIDLRQYGDMSSREAMIRQLELLSKERVVSGDLRRYTELVFAVEIVREGIQRLLREPTRSFVRAVRSSVGEELSEEQIRTVLPYLIISQQKDNIERSSSSDEKIVNKREERPEGGWSKDTLFKGKSPRIIEIYEQLVLRLNRLENTEIVYTQQYVRFSVVGEGLTTPSGRTFETFLTVVPRNSKLLLYLNLNWVDVPKLRPSAMRDVSNIWHDGPGEVEFSLASYDQLDDAEQLARLAYRRVRGA